MLGAGVEQGGQRREQRRAQDDPDRVPMPPTTTIIRNVSESMKLNVIGDTISVIEANSAPARPAIAPEMTKASSL